MGQDLYVAALDVGQAKIKLDYSCILRVGQLDLKYPLPEHACYVHLPFNDCEAVADSVLLKALELFDLHPGRFLVMCDAGLSRSASVAYMLLRLKHGLEHDQAHRQVSVGGEYYKTVGWPSRTTLDSVRNFVTSQIQRRYVNEN